MNAKIIQPAVSVVLLKWTPKPTVQRITRYPLLLKKLYSVQKETPEYDEKILDLAQISMLVVMAEQAAESAKGSAFFVTKFEIRFWKTSSIKCGEHVSTGFRLCDDKDSIDT